MMNKNDVRYEVNEKKKTVVCLVTGDGDIVSRIAERYLFASGFCNGLEMWNDELARTVFKGVAKCHPGDKWDVETGKRLAKDRAEAQLNARVNELLKQYVAQVRHAADLTEKYAVKPSKRSGTK